MFRYLIAMVLALTGTAQADTIGVHTVSWHDRPQINGEDWKWWTPGVYFRSDAGVTLGTLSNSEGSRSFYAAQSWSTDESATLSAAVTVGAITGYSTAPVLPLVAASAALKVSERVSIRAIGLPRGNPKGAWAVNLALEVRL